ncbi:MAG: MoaF N-terminal domain-containing protein, partial [Enterobacteriaceae bacterium]
MNNDVAFIPVGELAQGFALNNHTLPACAALAGKSLQCYFSDGETITCQFLNAAQLCWGDHPGVNYRASSIRNQFFFIDFSDPEQPHSTITLVCDQKHNCFTLIRGRMPDAESVTLSAFSRAQQRLPLTPVNAEICFGTL